MRRIALLAGMLLATVHGTAAAATLQFEPLGASQTGAVASARHGRIALNPAPGVVTVIGAGRPARSYAVPASCWASAAGPDAFGISCPYESGLSPAIVSLTDGSSEPVPAQLNGQPVNTFRLVALGSRWADLRGGDYAGGPFGDPSHTVTSEFFAERRGQRVISLNAVRHGPRGYFDLDDARLSRRLCEPIRRTEYHDAAKPDEYVPIARQGAWTLSSGFLAPAVLQRCGERRAQRFRASAQPVLGKGFVAYLTGSRIVLRHLRDGRRRTAPQPPGGNVVLSAAGSRLVVSVMTATGYVVYRSLR